MADFEVGYKKPPRHSQFKKGVCANREGRRKKKVLKESEAIRKVLNLLVTFRDRGKTKRSPRIELIVKSNGAAALKGDVGAAAVLLTLRAHFEKSGDINPTILYFSEGDMEI